MSNKLLFCFVMTLGGYSLIKGCDHLDAVCRQEGADVACATAKECPPDFRAKWVEAGCICVPTAATRHQP